MADDELDALYSVPPDTFTAERAKLVGAAKRRGDEAAAKRISAARKPTMAAWIVNRVAIRNEGVAQRLTDLGDRLRAAHTALDGDTIRDLSAEQHRLINELTRAALDAADVNPSAAVREDVTSTLQAAIADPELRARLGRLARPERWSGFGTFGDAAAVSTVTRSAKPKGESTRPKPTKSRDQAADRRSEKLRAAVATATRQKAEADDVLSERQAQRDAARLRRDEARVELRAAERGFDGAQKAYDKAARASRAAAESVKKTKAQLRKT
jgi:hypothetical protein